VYPDLPALGDPDQRSVSEDTYLSNWCQGAELASCIYTHQAGNNCRLSTDHKTESHSLEKNLKMTFSGRNTFVIKNIHSFLLIIVIYERYTEIKVIKRVGGEGKSPL
jgi:hypothetical protein